MVWLVNLGKLTIHRPIEKRLVDGLGYDANLPDFHDVLPSVVYGGDGFPSPLMPVAIHLPGLYDSRCSLLPSVPGLLP
jgi:hypothetical protein